MLQYYYNNITKEIYSIRIKIKTKGTKNMLKKAIIRTKKSIKCIVLFMISTFLILGAVAFLYKPTYSVYMNGKQIGYTEKKAELQHKINDYIENGEEENENIAFVQVSELPEYKLCLLKKNVVTNCRKI